MLVVHELHFPVETSHVEQPKAYALDKQQRLPAQEELVHSPSREQVAPVDFFGEHLESVWRK